MDRVERAPPSLGMPSTRTDDGSSAQDGRVPPAMFSPFRALGVVSGSEKQAWSVRRQGDATYVTVGTGESSTWQAYDCAKLRLVMVGPILEGNPSCIASAKRDRTIAAVGKDIAVCIRGHRAGTWTSHQGDIIQLLTLGDHVLSLGEDRLMCLWSIEQPQCSSPVSMVKLAKDFHPTCVTHPETYLNKVLVGDTKGRMQLWNIVTKKCIYEFSGWGSPVCCLAAAPAVDVVAVGLADGRVVVHNLKFDETIVSFHDTTGVNGGAVAAISFRTGMGLPIMAVGGGLGAITVWDLERKMLHTVIKDAHTGGITQLHFFVGEPVLMSSGEDNSIKQWIFDGPDGCARLLRYRSGHSSPPNLVRYYGDDRQILSAGTDRALRVFSTIQDQQSRELSQGHVESRAKKFQLKETELKLPEIVGMASSQVRERDWCNIITCHSGDKSAYLWSLKDGAIGSLKLTPPGSEAGQTPVACVCLSACGNFGIVGTHGGKVERFNVQSGLHRGSYKRINKSKRHPSRKRQGLWAAVSAPARYATQPAHDDKVTGICSDARNTTLISSSADGYIRFWDFRTRQLSGEIKGDQEHTRMAAFESGSLVATSGSEFVIFVYDAVAKRLVRRFAGHTGSITDLCFSSNGHWILSSSMDGTVRCWDVMHARVLQVMELGGTVSSLSLAPSMGILATSLVGRRGVYLWSNRLFYTKEGSIPPSEVCVNVNVPANVVEIEEELGNIPSNERMDSVSATTNEDQEEDARAGIQVSTVDTLPNPIAPGMATLSMVPRNHWRTLIHLEEIKERNKPIQPPKKPEAAPFFLPTSQGETFGKDIKFATEESDLEADKMPGSRVHRKDRDGIFTESEFVRLIRLGVETGDFTSASSRLRDMSPNFLEAEVRSMVLNEPGSIETREIEILSSVLEFVQSELSRGRNYELIQGFLGLFLHVHSEAIRMEPKLRSLLIRVVSTIRTHWKSLDVLFQETCCMLSLFTEMQ